MRPDRTLTKGWGLLLALEDRRHPRVPEEDVIDGQEEAQATEPAQIDHDHEITSKALRAGGLGEHNLLQLRGLGHIRGGTATPPRSTAAGQAHTSANTAPGFDVGYILLSRRLLRPDIRPDDVDNLGQVRHTGGTAQARFRSGHIAVTIRIYAACLAAFQQLI